MRLVRHLEIGEIRSSSNSQRSRAPRAPRPVTPMTCVQMSVPARRKSADFASACSREARRIEQLDLSSEPFLV